jgi:MFS family permease
MSKPAANTLQADANKQPFTTVQWLVCIIAAIGFAFDIYELLMLPLIVKPALAQLGGVGENGLPLLTPGSPAYGAWARTLFFVPALVGGVFGLIGGWLTDRLGRRSVLTFSILLYAFAAFAAGFSTNLWFLLVCRCLVFIGVCVEFVAAVAWLAELFPDPHRREQVLGYTQAFSSFGGFMVAGAALIASTFADYFPAIHGDHSAWRYTLISGVIPALPLILIRPFLPESPVWQRKREAGQLKRASILDLFSPELRATTIITTLIFASSYGFAFGAIQQLPQILGAPKGGQKQVLAEAAEKAKAAAEAAEKAGKPMPEGKRRQVTANAVDAAVADVTLWQEIGGLVGRFVLAFLAVQIASRRTLLRIFQVPALILTPLIFYWISQNLQTDSLLLIKFGIFFIGLLVVGQFSFWGNYIPLVFPLHLRGSGESFAANIGGRVIGTAAAWFTITFSAATPPDPAKIALTAAIVAGVYGLIGAVLTQWLPEPDPNAMDE